MYNFEPARYESNSNAHETLNRYVANHLILVHAERAILEDL